MNDQRNAVGDGKYVYLDPFLIDRRRINLGLSRTTLIDNMQVVPNTIKGVFGGSGILADTAHRLAKELQCQVTDLLSSCDPRYIAPDIESGPEAGATDWEMDRYLEEQGRLASNGLYYIVCRMQHRFTPSRRGRGKFYHLSLMNPQVREAMQDRLSRHAEVSARVGPHSHVALNLASSPSDGDAGWWVIDDWIGEHTLADRLESGAWPAADLPGLLLDVATGLEALHNADIVFRELAPARVLISDQAGRAVLTDFELAKLLDGSPSVSSEWPEDPFRAPEVDGGKVTVQADLFSFGKLAVAAAAGEPVAYDAVSGVFEEAGVPRRLAGLLRSCLEPVPDRRPDTLAPLLKHLTAWRKKAAR